MADKILKVGVTREERYLYYIDKDGDISRARMVAGDPPGGTPEKVVKCGIRKEPGYLYFLDRDGDVSRARLIAETPQDERPEVI